MAHDEWDPEKCSENGLSRQAKAAIASEITKGVDQCQKLPSNVWIFRDEEDISKAHLLVIGQFYTPYEGGFFYFLVKFPYHYPLDPPKVKLMNTGGGRVRFNPNIYANGMVCHPLLGTWHGGKKWNEKNVLCDVLHMLVDVMNEKPYKNEPFGEGQGFPELNNGDIERYNDLIRHETLRVAVCDVMEGLDLIPEVMRPIIEDTFKRYYEDYIEVCDKNKNKNYTRIKDSDPFVDVPTQSLIEHGYDIGLLGILGLLSERTFFNAPREGKFSYVRICKRLKAIKSSMERSDESFVVKKPQQSASRRKQKKRERKRRREKKKTKLKRIQK